VIVGDIHGSIPDLLRIFRKFGPPPENGYLFLGDYVDRGHNSIFVICLILALFVAHPGHVFVLRGNHEFAHINRVYGFLSEARSRYGDDSIWERFQDVFSWMPLAAVISGSVFCVHGGLSPELVTLQTLIDLEMPIPTYFDSPMVSDLVWSDPTDAIAGFQNNRRGSGKVFGPDRVQAFLKRNNLKFLIRAHQCVPIGWRLFANMLGVTLFSSSNYCDISPNKCGVVHFRDDKEMAFFTIDAESDFRGPPSLWTLPIDGDIGLKRLLRAASRSDLGAAAEKDDGELLIGSRIKRSLSLARSLNDLS
jgi:diadenosine tetraphosphatase ApaH/serine/threonine PP2A family protein phosphatase